MKIGNMVSSSLAFATLAVQSGRATAGPINNTNSTYQPDTNSLRAPATNDMRSLQNAIPDVCETSRGPKLQAQNANNSTAYEVVQIGQFKTFDNIHLGRLAAFDGVNATNISATCSYGIFGSNAEIGHLSLSGPGTDNMFSGRFFVSGQHPMTIGFGSNASNTMAQGSQECQQTNETTTLLYPEGERPRNFDDGTIIDTLVHEQGGGASVVEVVDGKCTAPEPTEAPNPAPTSAPTEEPSKQPTNAPSTRQTTNQPQNTSQPPGAAPSSSPEQLGSQSPAPNKSPTAAPIITNKPTTSTIDTNEPTSGPSATNNPGSPAPSLRSSPTPTPSSNPTLVSDESSGSLKKVGLATAGATLVMTALNA